MENIGVSTFTNNSIENQLLSQISIAKSAKTQQNSLNRTILDYSILKMDSNYTTPEIAKGKEPKFIPKGSTKEKEIAKNTWCIYFQCFNPTTGKKEVVRKTNGLNRIKDPKEKLAAFEALKTSYKTLLEAGYNPFSDNSKLMKDTISLTLTEAKEKYIKYLSGINTRKKSIQTYSSKINYLIEFFDSDLKINKISETEIKQFVECYRNKKKWSDVTFNGCKRILNAFFNYLISEKYITDNPIQGIKTITVTSTSEKHSVINDSDLSKLMTYLRANDAYTLFVVQMLYYTSIRPKELRQLQVKHIDLASNTITIPANISKNKKSSTISIDKSLRTEIDKLNTFQYLPDDYLIGDTTNIIGAHSIGENTPYNRFISALDKCSLTKKNYSLYSLKHTSNVKKFLSGWKLAEISKANRHSSISQTETYLRDLTKYIDVTEKEVPAI